MKVSYQKVNCRVDDLEFRSTEGFSKGDIYYEIVRWKKDKSPNVEPGKEFCYSLAIWERDKEGFYLRFVGDRPFEVADDFMKLAATGQAFLDMIFKLQEES